MASALTLRAWRELSRYRLRTVLSVLTLAAAVAGVWIFVTPRQLDAAMEERVMLDRIHDVILRVEPTELGAADVDRLRAVAGVEALEVRAIHRADARVGDRIQPVMFIGVVDPGDQHVNRVRERDGGLPGAGSVANDPQNERTGRLSAAVGEEIAVDRADGTTASLVVAGQASTIHYANWAVDGDPVAYVTMATLADLSGRSALEVDRIEFIVTDRSDEATAATIDAVRSELERIAPDASGVGLPEIRPVGEWPGEDEFDNFVVLFWVIGIISLVSAAVLVATTMNTLVRSQGRTIGIMKALGGRRRRIVGNFALTAVFLGGAATIVGIAIGLPLGNALVAMLARDHLGAEVGWSVSGLGLVLSIVVGLGGAVLASLPALRRVAATSVREAIGTAGIEGGFGRGPVDRAVASVRGIPRTWQLGLRGVVRRRGRSLATVVQVSLAVGTMLAFTSAVITMIEVSEQSRQAEGGDLVLRSTGSGRGLDGAAADRLAGVAGVARVGGLAYADVIVGATPTFVWGLSDRPLYDYELDDGRWFSAAEADAGAAVAVVGPALADLEHIAVGDEIRVETGGGSTTVQVVGLDSTMVGDGEAMFVPTSLVLAATGAVSPGEWWVTVDTDDAEVIDRIALAIRSELDDAGYTYELETRYVSIEAERASDRTVVAVILSLGIPIVAIGMIGVVNTLATTILERRREIGVLRSVGARSRDVRRVFRAEAVVLVVGGWLLGIVVGRVLGGWMMATINDAFHVEFPLRYPAWPIGVALVVALAVAALALWRPLKRAGDLPAGDALRYP